MTDIASLIDEKRQGRLKAYHHAPGDIREHAGIEESVLAGGYGYRQILELVQNGADAILEANELPGGMNQDARIEVVLREGHLYVANTGAPLSPEGVEALLQSHSSPKRGNQIGRFGLGFKSLLRLGGKLDVLSTSGSLHFDPELCKNEIRREFGLADDQPVPSLRLAWSLRREEVERADPMLASFRWATTVVRAEVRDANLLPHLRQEIHDFPSPFLLFLPVPVSLTLDSNDTVKRQLRRERDGQEVVLHEGGASSRWRVVEREVRVTDEAARNDATHLHQRETIPLAWAIPLDVKREEAGRFWAFFPTDTPSRLPGILNAPWKLNSDRKAIIPGGWNTALMGEAAKLVAETLPSLSTTTDPGRLLDAFPRQLERNDEPAAPLVEAVWTTIKSAAIIPDACGGMRLGSELKRPPLNDPELHAQWTTLATGEARSRWVHPSCLSGSRPSRLKDLADKSKRSGITALTQEKACAWLAEVVTADIGSTTRVLKLAEAYASEQQNLTWNQERQALAIIPSGSGQLCSPGQLVIAPAGVTVPGRESANQALVDDPETCRILIEILGVKRLDDSGWRVLLEDGLRKASQGQPLKNEADWQDLWNTLRAAPEGVSKDFLTDHREKVLVRRGDGVWVLHDEVLLPGSIVSADDPVESNRAVLADPNVHVGDRAFLEIVGVATCPSGSIEKASYKEALGENYNRLTPWLQAVEKAYRNKLDTSSKPQSGYLRPFALAMPRGWMLLPQLKGLANAKLTRRFLGSLDSLNESVDFGHITRPDAYPVTQVTHPMRWFVRQHGTFAIGQRAIPLSTVLARRHSGALKKADGWTDIAPRLDRLANLVGARSLPDPTGQQITDFWQALFEHLVTPEAITSDNLQDLWVGAAADGQAPTKLHATGGEVPLTEAFVTESANLAQRARAMGMLVVTLDSSALALWLDQGARSLDERIKPEWAETLSPPALLETAVPELSTVLNDGARNGTFSQSVGELRLVIEGRAQAIPCIQWQGVLHLDPRQLTALTRSERLAAILHEAAAAGWLRMSVGEAQRQIADAQVEANRARVAGGVNLPERLLGAVGGCTERLVEALGEGARKALPGDCPPLRIAELTLAMRGPTILQVLKDTLEAEGLQPPKRWGSDEARAFVAAIGFPDAFATASEAKRDAEESISGPISLPPLHDYQEEVIAGLSRLINGGTGRRRAVVSLPTGGGKTRVTVQAAVDLVLKREGGSRTVLWVAQTDELCEQAVQAFRQVWLNRGSEKTALRIIRFWGGHRNPSPSSGSQPTVVIASIQTLNSRIGKEGLEWLSNPGLVVVDECHHAITPSYTGLLKWLDAEAPRPGSQSKDEPPIIGLSATPFRGANDDEENRRLAKRFDECWLPLDQKKLQENLTHRGILAETHHEPLQSPSALPPELISRMALDSDLDGIQFENWLDEVNRLLANDDDRNRLLITTVVASRERSILFFTNSVAHAEEMATRLNLAGIPAAAIGGDTAPSARRYFLDGFQRGEIRVLCNHSVLTTGFDAPKTDMVLIARQVLSPVRYMQMVGRGLRGEKNGGTPRCRIVTVIDNLGRFSDRHPYHFCAKYFAAP